MVPSPSAKSPRCTCEAQLSCLRSQAQDTPAPSTPCSMWAPTRPYLPAGGQPGGEYLRGHTFCRFNVVLPTPSHFPFPLCLISQLTHTEAGRTDAPHYPSLVLFLQVVGGHPAFEGLHPVQNLAVPPAVGVPLQDLHGHALLEARRLLVPLIVCD